MLPAVCLLVWRWGLSGFLVSLHTLSKKKKSQCELTERALYYWSELCWLDLPLYTYLFKLPDIHVFFLVVLQRCFAISSASLHSLNSRELPWSSVSPEGSLAGEVTLSYQNNLCFCRNPVTQSSCRKSFGAFEGTQPAWKLVLTSPCQFWECLPRFAPPSAAWQRGNMWLRAIFAHMTLHSNSINIKDPQR